MTSPEPPFLSFEDAARRAGHCRWFEMRLFEVLGGWAEAEGDPRVRLLLRTHSFRHAWHAELWEARLPVSGPLDASELTVPASEGVAAVVDGLVASPRTEDGLERLAAVYRVVMPELVRAYGAQLASADPVAEGPTRRWLRLIVADEEAAGREGEQLLEDLARDPAEADRVRAEQSRLERLVAEAGGIPSTVRSPTANSEVE